MDSNTNFHLFSLRPKINRAPSDDNFHRYKIQTTRLFRLENRVSAVFAETFCNWNRVKSADLTTYRSPIGIYGSMRIIRRWFQRIFSRFDVRGRISFGSDCREMYVKVVSFSMVFENRFRCAFPLSESYIERASAWHANTTTRNISR